MDFPNTIDPEVILGMKVLAIFFALSVFWPRQGRKRHYFSRTMTLFFSTSLFAGLVVFDPQEFLPLDDGPEVSLVSWVTCEEGRAPWCVDVSHGVRPDSHDQEEIPLRAETAT